MLDFSNIVKKSSLERLAEADDHEVVRAVQEYFADYQVINPDLMCLNISYPEHRIWGNSSDMWHPDALQRSTEGLLALLLSLKKKPVIRYDKNSLMAKKLATEIRYQMTQEDQLFDFRKIDTPPILLILDRREDPLTPLLTQWTYQAMVHELLGIHNGRVDLRDVPDVRPELKVNTSAQPVGCGCTDYLQEIVLSQDQDPFFKKNMYANFGDLGQNAKDYVEQFASKSADTHKLESITDMKRFVEDYPEFRKLSGNVSKHVTLVGELSRRVGGDSLLDVSELEQSLACSDNHIADLRSLQQLLGNPAVPDMNKLRLVAIYALRYATPQNNSLTRLRELLADSTSLSPVDQAYISYLLAYSRSLHSSTSSGGAVAPVPDIFSQPTAILAATRSRLKKGLKGVENVYTQHSPILLSTLESLIRGRLSIATYPFLDNNSQKDKPQDIIVFMVGGTTFEEARVVAQVNASTPGVRVVLGGTSILNSQRFMDQVRGSVEGWPEVIRELGKAEGARERLSKEVGRR